MSPFLVGIIGIAVLLVLLFLKMPVAFVMAFVGFIGIAYLESWDIGSKFLVRDIFYNFANYNLGTILMFVLMGYYVDAIGIGRKLYKSVRDWVGHLSGGLAVATIGACALFSAASASSVATAAMMGKTSYPEMKRYGYDDVLSTGAIAAGGALGPLIPPSTILILYGVITEQAIGKLFIAGLIPGIILASLFAVQVAVRCKLNPKLGPPSAKATWRERFAGLSNLVEIAILFVIVIGGLAFGFFSATQGGAIGCAGALIIGLVRRNLSRKAFLQASKDGLQSACMILFIITGSVVFGHFIALSTLPFELVELVEMYHLSTGALILIISGVFFIGGFFIDSMPLMLLVVPIILPLLEAIGFNLILFGVMVVLLCETGVITPPVGVNVYTVKMTAPEVPLESIFKGAMPFVIAMLLVLLLVYFFPQLATFLPSLATM
jgi:C4-dicarboxylate transporter DctM subunit